ncbi:FAD-dependent monooxygenase [Xanthomonas rydalmerensis]|uniref:FAD-dependent monooxygenase n=1 Tax=Xanthomonas rydalmerensis TaxID=3046274 RepID=A0ABZ0JSY2_9XANT|nr:FAD-dependent monooxygenase [Xanthomonas sp. DM-2023]WOS42785.1 FAD-dependent monooxygenase [Xanthomonas sp. DM-2023]WOS46971.1 FAD-dependent monooxygenase [Xanthomonas sp. DM-2023]WOS51150.1 FAD-dependent monooxygenase [Xanthomonas sp. DM-2023]WOS55331.1 FAD-dependent monooxygenase [Xanthomonas sp. DM-2023]WOS59513.1 FAD-dependent monooxygenase [Xanthomonas sp. DM-2023]
MEIGILGGGIAGLSVALALHKQGHMVHVYERRNGPATMGAGVTLWPNAGFVLQELGLLEDVAAAGGRPLSVQRKDAAGNSLGGLDITLLDRLMGYPTHTILRRDLQAVLLDHVARAGIQVEFGHRAVAIDLDAGDKAVARFENGKRIRPDLLIGADGRMNSVARRFVAGDNTPIYQGFVNWIGVAQGSGALVSDLAIQDYWGSGDRFGCVPIRTDLVYWAAAQARPLPEATPAADLRKEVMDLFAGWPEPVARLIEATPAHTIQLIAVHDVEPLHTWSRANVLLVGDAAHAPLPTSGQGACQALEDAWHLARCLEEADGALAQALTRFTAIRGPKTTKLAEQGRLFARGLFAQDTETCRLRNERAKASDPLRDAHAMAAGWSQGLPMADCIDRAPANGAGSLYRL